MKALNNKLTGKSYKDSILIIALYAILFDIALLIILGIAYNTTGGFFENTDSPIVRILLGDEMKKSGLIVDLIGGGLIAPFVETVLFHIPFIAILRKLPVDREFIIVLTTVTFSSIHVVNGLIALVLTLPGSFFIAYTYLRYIDMNFKKAVFGAMLVHGLANVVLICIGYTYDYLIQ